MLRYLTKHIPCEPVHLLNEQFPPDHTEVITVDQMPVKDIYFVLSMHWYVRKVAI